MNMPSMKAACGRWAKDEILKLHLEATNFSKQMDPDDDEMVDVDGD